MCVHYGLIQFSRTFNQPLDDFANVIITQQRRGGRQVTSNAKRRHNARIDPTAEALYQAFKLSDERQDPDFPSYPQPKLPLGVLAAGIDNGQVAI